MKDSELVHDFVVESLDLLDNAEPKLISLQHLCEETGDIDNELVNAIFRLFHSMKGGAGMLNLQQIQSLTHTAETLLDLFRKGSLRIDLQHTDVLLRSADLIRRMLEQTNETYSDEGFEQDVERLVKELNSAIKGERTAAPVPAKKEESVAAREEPAPPAERQAVVEAALPADTSAPANESPQAKDQPATKSKMADDLGILITDEMVTRFVNEALDLLEQAEHAIMSIEQKQDLETMQLAFRCIHSFKGNCGFMGHIDPERLSHKMETVLDGIRSGTLRGNQEIFSTLLQCIDVLRSAIASVNKDRTSEIDNVDLYIDFLGDLVNKYKADPSTDSETAGAPVGAAAPPMAQTPAEREEVTTIAEASREPTPPPLPLPLLLSRGRRHLLPRPRVKPSSVRIFGSISSSSTPSSTSLENLSLQKRW